MDYIFFQSSDSIAAPPWVEAGLSIQFEDATNSHYLDRTFECLERSMFAYRRLCMMRFDLHVPENCSLIALASNEIISKFFASLKAKISHAQRQSRKNGNRVHDTDLRYVWCRELSSTGNVHFHVALLLNHDAYAHFGKFDLENDNMYSRIHGAWASALSMFSEDTLGLVHIPKNPIYSISAGDHESFESAFYRLSYFCKEESKELNQGFHSFGCSRI